MVAAPVALVARGRFERVDHEAQAGAGWSEECGFVGAGAAGGRVCHLSRRRVLVLEEGIGGEMGEGRRGGAMRERGVPVSICRAERLMEVAGVR